MVLEWCSDGDRIIATGAIIHGCLAVVVDGSLVGAAGYLRIQICLAKKQQGKDGKGTVFHVIFFLQVWNMEDDQVNI